MLFALVISDLFLRRTNFLLFEEGGCFDCYDVAGMLSCFSALLKGHCGTNFHLIVHLLWQKITWTYTYTLQFLQRNFLLWCLLLLLCCVVLCWITSLYVICFNRTLRLALHSFLLPTAIRISSLLFSLDQTPMYCVVAMKRKICEKLRFFLPAGLFPCCTDVLFLIQGKFATSFDPRKISQTPVRN